MKAITRLSLTLMAMACAVAVLSAAASYPTSTKSFTTKTDGATISAAHINDLQDEIVAIENGLRTGLAHHVLLATGKYLSSNGRATGDGVFLAPTFAAASYTASTGNWTVDVGDVGTLSYTVVGNMMTVLFIIQGTDVSATPTTLSVAIPGGFVAAVTTRTLIQSEDAGTLGTGVARVSGNGSTIDFFKNAAGTAWTLTAADNTGALGQITFAVVP